MADGILFVAAMTPIGTGLHEPPCEWCFVSLSRYIKSPTHPNLPAVRKWEVRLSEAEVDKVVGGGE